MSACCVKVSSSLVCLSVTEQTDRYHGSCRYYTEQIHQASFTLPKFAHDGLKGSLSTTH